MNFRTILAIFGLTLVALPVSAQPQHNPDMHQQHMQGMAGMSGLSGMATPAMSAMKCGKMMGGSGIMAGQHVEGNIAFLKIELGVTVVQEAEWRSFAEALRTAGKQGAEMRKRMEEMCPMHQDPKAPAPTIVEKMADREKRMSERLASVKAINAALAPLYAKFSAEQKKLAEELLPAQLGRGGMMSSQMGGMMGGQGCGMKH
jgi:hypothetical protein